MRTKIILSLLPLSISVSGQYTPSDIDLNAAGLNPTLHAKMRVRDMPDVAGDIAKAKAKFPAAYGYLKDAKGWVDGDGRFLLLSVASAYGLQGVWSGHALAYTQPCISRNHITAEGEYWVNYPIPKHMGFWEGAGPHLGWYPSHSALTFHVWKEAWLGDDVHEMCSMLSTGYKLDGGAGWLHGGRLEGIGFVGNNSGWYDPSYTESGLVLWDEAEASSIGNLWSDSHNGYGVKIIRGTPTNFTGTLSVFTNALGGVGLFDGELGTVNLGLVSGDDNPALVVMDSKYGRGAGGMVSFELVKSESGKRTPNKGQIVLWQRSPCVGAISIDMTQADMNDQFIHAPFVMNSRAWGQTLTVTGFVGWNLKSYLHDVTNKEHFPGATYTPMVWVWCSRNGGTFSDLVTLTHLASEPVNATDRLGMVPNNGVFDYVNGTPKYTMGAPPPPPTGTWTCTPWSAWSACSTGVQTRSRTCTCSGTCGARPMENEIQPCGTPPQTMTATAFKEDCVEAGSIRPPSAMLDGNNGTFWMGCAGMTANGSQWVLINQPTASVRSGVTFTQPIGYTNSYPRTFTVELSTNGTAFGAPKSYTGTAAKCEAKWTAQSVKAIRIKCTSAAAGAWWGINTLTIQ